MTHGITGRRRWLALIVLCLGVLMIVLDTTIVNVALPSIKSDLGFSEAALVWVVNAYMLTFGGFLLLGGRLGDLFGHRRMFLSGITLFTLASLACGLAGTQGLPLAGGLLLAAAGLALFAQAPVDGGFAAHILPGMVLLGVGAGIAFNPLLLAAMSDVDPAESGLASGVVNTAFMMGGSLGLAVLASLAAARSAGLLEAGLDMPAALSGGHRAAFAAGAVCAAASAVLGALLLRTPRTASQAAHKPNG